MGRAPRGNRPSRLEINVERMFSDNETASGRLLTAQVARLRAAGYSFYAAPGAFAVHVPHEESSARKRWRVENSEHRTDMDAIYQDTLRRRRADLRLRQNEA